MELAFVVFSIVVIVAIGVVIYLWVTMKQQLDNANTQIASANAQITATNSKEADLASQLITESSTRHSTLSNVVDQINDVNDTIYGAVAENTRQIQSASSYFNSELITNVNTINSNINGLQQQQNSINSGLGKFMVFKTNSDGTGPTVPLAALPGVAQPDVQLIQHVTSTMGMTVNDLHADTMTINGDLNLPKSWKLQTQDGNLCFVHGMNTVACLSDAAEKLQIYQNSDKNTPYLYYNSTGQLGNNPGGPYQLASAATAAQTAISQTASQTAAAGASATQAATQTANQAAATAQAAITAAQAAAAQATSAQAAAVAAQTAAAAATVRAAAVTVAAPVAAAITSVPVPATVAAALPATPSTPPAPKFTTFTFTNMGAVGARGPTTINYSSLPIGGLTLTNGIQYWTVPTSGSYRIVAAGAGTSNWTSFTGGRGIIVASVVSLTAGSVVKILVGQQGTNTSKYSGSGGYAGYGAGGGTFVTTSTNSPLLIAGGGGNAFNIINGPGGDAVASTTASGGTAGGGGGSGGAGAMPTSNDHNGGAGFTGNACADTGPTVAQAFVNGGNGATYGGNPVGGFGGGGGIGGGGGYSGGGCINWGASGWGGGGGSYDVNGTLNAATQYTDISGGYNTGAGFVIISAV